MSCCFAWASWPGTSLFATSARLCMCVPTCWLKLKICVCTAACVHAQQPVVGVKSLRCTFGYKTMSWVTGMLTHSHP